MASTPVFRLILSLGLVGALSACVETGGSAGSSGGAGRVAGAGAARSGAEVEAPEIFQVTDSALWDGRPSLGGIWVASPDVKDPERVIMFNPSTGKSVKGALFRRERDNPGPRLQLSSDAAEALGIVAGMPTEIQVTALRKEETAEPPADVAPAADEAAASPVEGVAAATAVETEGDKDAASVAAAALDAVGAPAEGATAGDDVAATEGTEGTETAKPKTWKEKRAEAKAAREAKKAAKAAEKAAAEAAAAGVAGTGEAPVTPDAVAGDAIEAAPLDATAGAATGESDKQPTAESEAPAAVDPAPVVSGGAVRSIQIGTYSKEDNAKRAVEALSKVDIAAEVKKIEKDGKVVWSVVARGDATLLQQIKDAGFADAFFLK